MHGSKRLVLADDHGVLRQGVRELLRGQPDLEVVAEASNAHEAVELARRLAPDIVVMDLRMPDMSGIEATRLIRQQQPKVAIIALSSSCDASTVRATMAAGASGFVAKESAFEELLTAIHAVLEGRPYFGQGIEPPMNGNNGCCELTSREREVLKLLVSGNTTKGAAMSLNLSAKTIETHRRNLMQKLEVDNLADLTKYAIRMGLTPEV